MQIIFYYYQNQRLSMTRTTSPQSIRLTRPRGKMNSHYTITDHHLLLLSPRHHRHAPLRLQNLPLKLPLPSIPPTHHHLPHTSPREPPLRVPSTLIPLTLPLQAQLNRLTPLPPNHPQHKSQPHPTFDTLKCPPDGPFPEPSLSNPHAKHPPHYPHHEVGDEVEDEPIHQPLPHKNGDESDHHPITNLLLHPLHPYQRNLDTMISLREERSLQP